MLIRPHAHGSTPSRSLAYSLSCAAPDGRNKLLRSFQRLLVRARETVRATEREAAKACAASQSELDRVMEFVGWLCATLQAQLYPGAPFAREILALELLHSAATELVPLRDAADESRLALFLSSHLWTRDFAITLMGLFLSTWDRSRSLAIQLLLRFPLPLVGFGTHKVRQLALA